VSALRVALAFAACAGCGSTAPSVVVTLGTDLDPCRLPTLRLRCAYDWDGLRARETPSCDQVLYRGASLAEVRLPASFGLLGDRSGRALTLVVDDGAAVPALRRVARLTPPSDGEAWLTIVLRGLCLDAVDRSAESPCPAGSARCTRSQSCEQRGLTCGDDGACRPLDVTAAELATPADPTALVAPTRCDAGAPPG
jgi:hypothetical protein